MAGKSGMTWGRRSSPHRLSPAWALLVLALAAPACRGTGAAALFDGPEEFYGLRALPDFRITLDSEARASLKRTPREWVQADFRYGAMRWTVGLRLKGHRSLRKLDDKPSFKIKLNRVDPRARFFGKKSLVLNNLVEDPTLVREIFSYRLHRQLGVPAPDVGYARVYLDGEYNGVYLFVEAIDDEFLEARFDDDEGHLYEGEYGCDLYPGDVEGFELEEGSADRSDLAALARVAAGPVGGLLGVPGARFDPSAMTFLAVSALIGDFDGYRHAHNYRLYHEPTADRWFFIPWGLDRTLKQSMDVLDSAGLVARRCFADRDCRIAYYKELRRAAEELERMGLDRGIDVLRAFVKHAEADDDAKPYDAARTESSRADLIAFLRRRPSEIRAATACLDGDREIDDDGDGFGCLDCADQDPVIHPGAVEACDGRDDDCNGLVDDAAACACPEVVVEGIRFELCNLPVRWSEAAAMCLAKGGSLARVDSAAQSRQLFKAARKVADDRWWIGLRDGNGAAEGQFAWSDGTPLTFTYWVKGDPDNDGCSQDCVALRDGGDGRWHDTHCEQPEPFICRF